ncbi:serine hydrolase domain-containing protein [Sinomicrobium oceani]|uniref:serine hydrolase domain-containing protein n=1 Tax=Sinomicrobium oceani TaxID=1150368 RepID=UPI00227A70EC|nr:serine hydrolase domain-containing protein [Sinomicrobium oceani]
MIRIKTMRHLPALVLLVLTGQWCFAQIPEPVNTEIKTRVDNGVYPSVVLGLWENGKAMYFTYGFKNTERREKADKNTLYETGSVTKTYTTLLLAKYVSEGKLSLDFPADTLLPDTIKLRDKKGTPITLKHLATHTSGMPRLPGNMNPPAAENPYKTYDRKALFSFLKHYEPTYIGTRFFYSNLGMGLLGELLAYHEKTAYGTLLKKNVLAPLNLEHTYVHIPVEQEMYRATGYRNTTAVSPWDFKALAGAGAVKANIGDLLHYGVSYLAPENPLKKAAALSLKTHYTDRFSKKHGLAWNYEGSIAFHDGATGGFRSFLAINPEKKRVVAIMTNSGINPVDDLAMYLASPESRQFFITPAVKEISTEKLRAYTGHFENNGAGLDMEIATRNNQLYARIKGQSEFPLYYTGKHQFFYKNILAVLQFETDEYDTVVGVLLRQNGQEILLIKD